ncbi:hypothetical protein H4219_006204 [Mycoemilia scoparia]|uniref:Uncharacterized protein n=1 Tax=Mycoemilia scoparia TaxID=417184 RepID=A0A9W8DMH7_9FUNG|nr:hypothetical protein H4219_006204 [Mycoemilia scoparia]
MDLSAFTDTDSRLCCEAIMELLGSLEDIPEHTQFNKHGIDMDTLDNLKAALKKHMERQREYIMNLCDQFEQGNVSAEHLQSAFLKFHKDGALPFVERYYGDGKYKTYIKSGNTMIPVTHLDYLNIQAGNIFSKLVDIISSEANGSEKGALAKAIKLYLHGFSPCINGIHDYHGIFGNTDNHESPDIDDNARKLIKEDIFDFINEDLARMSEFIRTLFPLVKQGDKALLFAQFKDHFEKSFKVYFDAGKAKSFDDVTKFNLGKSIDKDKHGAGFIDRRYSILALFLFYEAKMLEDGSN